MRFSRPLAAYDNSHDAQRRYTNARLRFDGKMDFDCGNEGHEDDEILQVHKNAGRCQWS